MDPIRQFSRSVPQKRSLFRESLCSSPVRPRVNRLPPPHGFSMASLLQRLQREQSISPMLRRVKAVFTLAWWSTAELGRNFRETSLLLSMVGVCHSNSKYGNTIMLESCASCKYSLDIFLLTVFVKAVSHHFYHICSVLEYHKRCFYFFSSFCHVRVSQRWATLFNTGCEWRHSAAVPLSVARRRSRSTVVVSQPERQCKWIWQLQHDCKWHSEAKRTRNHL